MEQWNKLRNDFCVSVLRVPLAQNKGGTDGEMSGTKGYRFGEMCRFLVRWLHLSGVTALWGAGEALPDGFCFVLVCGEEETGTPREQVPERLGWVSLLVQFRGIMFRRWFRMSGVYLSACLHPGCWVPPAAETGPERQDELEC